MPLGKRPPEDPLRLMLMLLGWELLAQASPRWLFIFGPRSFPLAESRGFQSCPF